MLVREDMSWKVWLLSSFPGEMIHMPVMSMTDGFPVRGFSQKMVIIHSMNSHPVASRYEDTESDQT